MQVAVGMVVLVFGELGKLGILDPMVGWLVAIAMAITGMHHYYSLGNDNLSPLLGIGFVWLHLLHLRLGRMRDLWLASIVAGLGFVCKYTNGMLMPMHVVGCWISHRAGIGRSFAERLKTTLVPIGMAGLVLAGNQLRFGDALNTGATADLFAPHVPPIEDLQLFLTLLVHDSFLAVALHVDDLRFAFPSSLAWSWWFFGALAVNCGLLGLCAIRGCWKPRQTFVALACGIAVGVVGAAVALNTYKPVAHWCRFRHWVAYTIFWVTAVSISAVELPRGGGRLVSILGGIVSTVFIAYFALAL